MYPDFFDSDKLVAQYDPEVADAMDLELGRQRRNIELIASENFVSPAVMAAMGSVLTNKYAEGYPGKRYYGGCEYVDIVENLAIERAKELFGADCANVQPHSGAQANMAAYSALINPGDTVMGMSLAHGGHLTHGSPVNFSGKLFNNVFYGVNRETGCIDYDEVARIAREHKPAAIVAGASAYPRKIDFARFRAIAEVERHHRDRFLTRKKRIDDGTMWKREKPIRWQCLVCGYIFEGTEPPEVCPACLHPYQHYIPAEENY